MGAKLWFVPVGADRSAEIAFGRNVLIDGPYPVYFQTVQESVGGVQSAVIYTGRSVLSLTHTWTRGTADASGDGDLLRRKLFALITHLQRGGTCTFAGDSNFAVAGFATQLPHSQAGTVVLATDLFKNLSGGFGSTGRELMVHSDCDEYLIEHKICSAHAGKSFTLTQPIAVDMSRARWVLLREYESYPALRMPKEYRTAPMRDFLPHDHELIFRLTLPLEEDPAMLDAYQVFGVPIPGTAHGPGHIQIDPDVLVPGQGSIGGLPYEWKG